ncbi:hypothetical protein [Streptomyces noursei]|uniref:hypothetical protein n=1 Tax=Streptomyces noursei TaxID=1971 RepID=UPI0019C0CBEC|nr:hypothetical protein [Streptomyces noursei]MCZ1021446.1 hypothetical protein [Streptomyces noursei]GGX46514.1 hypothetical protein GCM10010341_80340 [Streptomyces noursei]
MPINSPAIESHSVSWEIDDLDATSPRDAARMALALIRSTEPDNFAHVFSVYGPDGKRVDIDLDPLPEDQP